MKITRKNSLLALGVLVFSTSFASAGFFWKKRAQLDQAVWSEDGSEIAYLVLHYEEGRPGPGDGTTPKRKFAHELRVKNADGSGDRVLASVRPGQNGAEFYRMKCAGYTIVPVVSESSYRVDLLRDSGGVQVIDAIQNTHCDGLHVIPSPHGEYIAKIKTRGCLPDHSAGLLFDVVILKSDSLTVSAHYTVPGMNLAAEFAWNVDSQFVLSDDVGSKYMDPKGLGVIDVSRPYPCTVPATTSSNLSAKSIRLEIQSSDRGSQIVPVPAVGEAQPFACDAHKTMDMSCKLTQH